MLKYDLWRHRLVRSRTLDSHSSNWGSNPHGAANVVSSDKQHNNLCCVGGLKVGALYHEQLASDAARPGLETELSEDNLS